MHDKLDKLFISLEASIKEAMKQMDLTGEKILIVVDRENKLLGTMTDGDIRRFILKSGSTTGQVALCFNKTSISQQEGDGEDHARNLMIENKLEAIPVTDKDKCVRDLFVWSDLFKDTKRHVEKIDVPVVIMAGGKGERLDPFTKILPKSLIPVGEKPILEVIMDTFNQHGIKNFYLTVNYKGEMIKSYFENVELMYNLNFIWEKDFLGTAGGLRFLPEDFPKTFIVSNCDILVDADYSDLLKFHKENKNDLTMIGAFKHHIIPYGVIEFSTNGTVEKITEKPEYDFNINTGVYVMEKKTLNYIPKDKFFHTTHLMENLLKDGKKIGVYPVSEKSYIDIGQWEEYRENVRRFLG